MWPIQLECSRKCCADGQAVDIPGLTPELSAASFWEIATGECNTIVLAQPRAGCFTSGTARSKSVESKTGTAALALEISNLIRL